MADIHRDVEVPQALHLIADQSADEGHDLHHRKDLGALQGQPPGHDHADVAGAQDDHPFAGHLALDVDEALGRTGGIDAGGACSGDPQRAEGALAAPHAQNGCLGADLQQTVPVQGGDPVLPIHPDGHGLGHEIHTCPLGVLEHFVGIRGPGEGFLEVMQAEAVVDALRQHAAQLL